MMHSRWSSFLRKAGAHIKDGMAADFGNPGEETRSAVGKHILVDLSQFAIIRITGKDAADFLHGQFTSNIHALTATDLQSSSWCNPRGQVLANFLLLKPDAGFLLLLPQDMKTYFMQGLQRYILRADVTLQDESESLVRVGISGPDLSQAMNTMPGSNQDPARPIQHDKGITLLPLPADKARSILLGGIEAMQAAWHELADGFRPAGAHCWALLDILAGLPWITQATAAMFLPQMLNLDSLGGLSYQKGCYPGQEIITRLQQRGQLKRKLCLARTQNGEAIQPGRHLFSRGDQRAVGTVINIAPDPAGGHAMLAVVETAKTESAEIIPEQQDNSPLTFQPLPCPLHV